MDEVRRVPWREGEKVRYEGVEYIVDELGGGGVNVSHFKVMPDLRGEGRGRAVMAGIERTARERGRDYMVVNMGDSERAAPMLEYMGFDVVEESRDHVTAEKELGFV
jgi:GNAT superfamily N-acetyltransferase